MKGKEKRQGTSYKAQKNLKGQIPKNFVFCILNFGAYLLLVSCLLYLNLVFVILNWNIVYEKEFIKELFQKFEQSRCLIGEIECWSARDLQEIFGYTEWRNFLKVVDKAKNACQNSGIKIIDHFVDVNKMIEAGKGAKRGINVSSNFFMENICVTIVFNYCTIISTNVLFSERFILMKKGV